MSVTVTWLGQSGLLLEGGGQAVLVDPWLSPHSERAGRPPVVDWPSRIDLVLITHGHGDHLDLPGLASLTGKTQLVEIAAPYPHLRAIAASLPALPRLDARPNTVLGRLGGVTVLPAWHGVSIADGYGTMIGADGSAPHVGYVFTLGGLAIYVAGDTIADPQLVDAVRPLGPELVFLPVNGRDATREANGILGNMSAAEAVDFAVAVGAKAMVPLHHDGVIGNTADIGEVARAAWGKPLHLILPAPSIPFAIDGNRP